MTREQLIAEGVVLLLRRHAGEAYNEWVTPDDNLRLALIDALDGGAK